MPEIEKVLTFMFNNLEYIVAGIGGIGAFLFIKTRKIGKTYSNNLTYLVVKHNKNKEAITKRSKSTI